MAYLLFWLSATVIVYTYFGYPCLIWLLAKRSGPLTPSDKIPNPSEWPTIDILIPCHNEAKHIETKIKSLLSSDYPSDKINLLFISDGSEDATEEILKNHPKIKLISYHPRQGKPTAINQGIAAATAPILILTDARQEIATDAISKIVKRLLQPGIGAVSGELVFRDPKSSTGEQVSLYWKYEKALRNWESKVSSVTGVTGALYAIRRKDACPLNKETILDDLEMPLGIIYQGSRCILEAGAEVYDTPLEDTSGEMQRKIRTLTGNFQSFARHRWLFSPRQNPIWLQFISHKLLRLLVPYALFIALLSNFFLLSCHPIYKLAFIFQMLFYATATLSQLKPKLRKARILSFTHMFCSLNWAAVIAFKNFASKNINVKWEKTQ